MDRTTISQAAKTFELVLQILDDAYWSASKIESKDTFYDLIGTLQKEVNELAKLSVEDHYMAYEPITAELKNSVSKVKTLHNELHQWVSRTKVSTALESELPILLQMLAPSR